MMDIDRHRLMYFDIYLPLMNVLIPLYIQFMNYWYPNEKSEEPQKPQDTKKTDLKYQLCFLRLDEFQFFLFCSIILMSFISLDIDSDYE